MGSSFYANKFYQPRLTVPNTEVTLADKDATGDYMVIDRVSTIYLAKWVMPGQSGRTRTGEQGGANEEFQTGDLKHLISAYRKIDVTGNWGQRGTSAEPSGLERRQSVMVFFLGVGGHLLPDLTWRRNMWVVRNPSILVPL